MANPATTVMRFAPATRGNVPLVIGLQGPPGGGKTYSALLIAKGIQTIRSGPIRVIDTESGRSRKYSDYFDFEVLELDEPRGDVLADALRLAVADDPAAVIVDTISDEHEELLAWHEEEIDKLLDDNERQVQKQRDRVGMSAWRRPKFARRQLLKFLRSRVRVPLILNFRSEEKTKLIDKTVVQRNGGGEERRVTVPTNVGWQPIAPSQIVHFVDMMCLLPLRAEGLPMWQTGNEYSDFAIKRPEYFRDLFLDPRAKLTEAQGKAMAVWASGQPWDELLEKARSKACEGYEPLAAWWRSIPKEQRAQLRPHHDQLVDCARKVDEEAHKAEHQHA